MKRKIALLTLLIALSGIAIYTTSTTFAQSMNGPATPHREAHPRIRHAIAALHEAKVEMKAAAHDFGGHRVAAIKACDDAIEQLKLALQYDKN